MNGRSWRRRLPLLLIYLGPLLVWIAVLFAASTQVGRYEVSARLLQKALRVLAGPGPEDITYLALYSLNRAARRLAHVGASFVLTLLIVRAVQWGSARLRWRSLICAFLVNIAIAVGEMVYRNRIPRRHGDLSDLALNLAGGVLALLITALYFAGKRWEQKAWEAAEAAEATQTGAASPPEEATEKPPP